MCIYICIYVCMYMYICIISNLVFSFFVRISRNVRKRNWCEHPMQSYNTPIYVLVISPDDLQIVVIVVVIVIVGESNIIRTL